MDDFFTCKCENPPDPTRIMHRVPIDCNTKEDRLRQEATVYVLYWQGDEDCGGRNDGAFAIYSDRMAAWAELRKVAEQHYDAMRPVEDGYTDADWSRDGVYVKQMMIEDYDG